MKKRDYCLLFLAGLVISSFMIFIRPYTGYMDADYYFATAKELASGHGFIQNFLWNYLDNPVSIPHPAFTYWMPLSSLIATTGLWIFKQSDLLYARIPFVLIYAFVPVITALITYRISSMRTIALIAGCFSIFSGFYLRFIAEPDSFGISMILGPLIILATGISLVGRKRLVVPVFVGTFCGLMHMSRADGVLWLVIGALGLIYSEWIFEKSSNVRTLMYNILGRSLFNIGLLIAGYFLITFPWYFRNIEYFHSIFPPGNPRTLFLTEYDQIFSYPASNITFLNWWRGGIGRIISSIFLAAGTNITSAIVVQGNIILLPLAVLGMLKQRLTQTVKLTIFAWLIIFISMSVVFPYAGSRGGYLHSVAAIQPLIWAYSGYGLSLAIRKGIKWRKWNGKVASMLFSGFAIFIAIIISGYIVIGDKTKQEKSPTANLWNDYALVEDYLNEDFNKAEYMVMVNNPPAYNIATNREAVVLPYGNLATLNDVASRFGIDYLIIDQNHIQNYRDLYEKPRNYEGLIYRGSVKDYRIYEFKDE